MQGLNGHSTHLGMTSRSVVQIRMQHQQRHKPDGIGGRLRRCRRRQPLREFVTLRSIEVCITAAVVDCGVS
jgi:hypothetical protein